MPSPDGYIDLRSDTVTTPTPEMRRAMADAEVGDDVYGEDPTINRFQDRAAELLGKAAALYSAVQLHPFPDDDGLLDTGALDETARDAGHHSPDVSLIAIENTHMPTCGRPWRTEEVAAVSAVADTHGIALYCDGARIWNAAVALGVPARELVAPATAVMFCVSKGLGAPVGSVLCGPREMIREARVHRQRLGGGMRQAGVIAAAGLVALDSMIDRLADDHRRARRLAEAVAERWPGAVAPDAVETNMVCAIAERLPCD